MKKIFCLFFCIILLSGCNKKSSEVTAVTTGLSFDAIVVSEDTETEYNITISKKGEINAVCPSNGISYKYNSDSLDITYKELTYSTDLSSVPEGFILDFINTVFKDCSKKSPLNRNNQYFLKGNTENYNYTIYFGATGLPLKIETQNLTITIKKTTIITKSS